MQALELEGLLLESDFVAAGVGFNFLVDMVAVVDGAFEVVAQFVHDLHEHPYELFLLRVEEICFELVHLFEFGVDVGVGLANGLHEEVCLQEVVVSFRCRFNLCH
jgi:hypothetical protein